MDPIILLLLGMAIVIGGILFFRLHAFLALILAALAVAGLTKRDNISQFHFDAQGIRATPIEGSADAAQLHPGSKQKFIPGQSVILRANEDERYTEVGRARVELITAKGNFGENAPEVIHTYYELSEKSGDFNIQAGDRVLHHTLHATALSTATSTGYSP